MGKAEQERLLSEIPEDRKGKVKDFGEMKHFLQNQLHGGELNLLKSYFSVQIQARGKNEGSEGRRKKAREMYRGLKEKQGWEEFADKRISLLVLVDIAVRGETRQFEEPYYRPVDMSKHT